MSALRPLPPRLSLEFERKEAKALHRRLRAGDFDALARARERHPALDASQPARIKLADAQLVIAREYGFASWPRLVRYFQSAEQGEVERTLSLPQRWDGYVHGFLTEHRDRRVWVGRALAAYVPRFYGWRLDDIFASPVTEDDARLAIARQWGSPSWEVLLERSRESPRGHGVMDWRNTAMLHARKAMEAGDLGSLERVVAAHPELLHIDDHGGRLPTLLTTALAFEKTRGMEVMRPIMDWLVSQGLDLKRALNEQLHGHMEVSPENVRWLLDRGADPNWIDLNGIPALEYALVNYWNGEAVDVLAERARPRRALWISAGLGDVEGVRRSLDAKGRPTRESRRLRPPFHAAVRGPVTPHPDPDDEEILVEAFVVAMLNGRIAVLECMVERGFPLNSLTYGSPLINVAVGNGWTAVVECLVRGGADLDVRGWRPEQSARELAREFLENAPDNTDRRRIAELCGIDVERTVANAKARPLPPPAMHAFVETALDLASDDAARLGRPEVDAENLLFGLLRCDSGSGLAWTYTRPTGMDVDRFRDDMSDRIRAPDDRIVNARLPLRADTKAAINAAIATVTGRREYLVTTYHVMRELLRNERGPARELLRRYGGDASKLIAELELGHAPVQVRSKPRQKKGSTE